MMLLKTNGVLSIIAQSDITTLLIASLFFLPLLLATWLYVLKQLGLAKENKGIPIMALTGIYVIALIAVAAKSTDVEKLSVAEQKIVDYLDGQENQLMGFNQIQQVIDITYSYEFLEELALYSDHLVGINIKSSNQDDRGIKLKGFSSMEKKCALAESKIHNFLKSRGIVSIKRDNIRKWVDPTYSDELIETMMHNSPNIIHAMHDNGYDAIEFTNLSKTVTLAEK